MAYGSEFYGEHEFGGDAAPLPDQTATLFLGFHQRMGTPAVADTATTHIGVVGNIDRHGIELDEYTETFLGLNTYALGSVGDFESIATLFVGFTGVAIQIEVQESEATLFTGFTQEADGNAGPELTPSSAYLYTGFSGNARPRKYGPKTSPKLGCGDYEIFIQTRGGHTRLGQLPAAVIDWSRVLDGTSTASIKTRYRQGANVEECCQILSQLNPWEHEMLIRRNQKTVWVGPITNIEFLEDGEVAIDADDLTIWWDVRFLHEEHNYDEDKDIGDVIFEYHTDAMRPDPSPNFTVEVIKTGLPIGELSPIDPELHQIAGDEIRNLAKDKVDYTFIAAERKVIVATDEIPPSVVPQISTLRDEHWIEPPTVVVSGFIQANRVVVQGAGGGALGEIWGDTDNLEPGPDVRQEEIDVLAEASLNRYGLLERMTTDSALEDEIASGYAAITRLEALHQPTEFVDKGKLAQIAPMTQEELIPGARVKVLLQQHCRKVYPLYRLDAVNVSVQDNEEQVSITLTPLGTVSE